MAHNDKKGRPILVCQGTTWMTMLFILALLTPANATDLQTGSEAVHEQSDFAAALRELRMLAEQGNAEAQLELGLMYQRGKGVPEDNTEAVKWYRKAAEQGNTLAQTLLGFMHAEGRGVPEDDTEAVKWYRRAAEQGNAEAQLGLGLMYDIGRGVPEDDTEAVTWFRRAAEQGNVRAQAVLGLMYDIGRGVPQDVVQAYAWLNIATAQGRVGFVGAGTNESKKRIAESMTHEERVRAQKLSREYWEAYVLPFRN